jgi:riboflavin kinase/FMN adenylyltransferase
MSFSQKLEMLAKWGISQVICLRFNHLLAGLSPLAFMENYLVKGINVRHLLVGEDFRFGHQQKGDVQTLLSLGSQFNVEIEPIKHIQDKNNKISSTFIRKALIDGDITKANALLGRNFSVKARVVKGAMRGRQLGFPTANLPCSRHSSPLCGVFVTKVHFDHKTYFAATNIGTRPTIDGENRIIEAHVLDFSGNLYGKKIEVEFLHKLRDEKRFSSIDLLIQQIECDIEQTRDFFINTPMEV